MNPNPWLSLAAIIEQMSNAGAIGDLATVIRHRARELTGADGVTFVLREGDHCHYVEEDAIAPLWKGRRFPLETCISGWCMLHKQTAVIPDIYVDPRIPFGVYRPTFVRSLVMVPVRVDDPLAAIGTYWAKQHRPDDEMLDLIEALARSTAVGIELVRTREALAVANRNLGQQQVPRAHDSQITP